MSQFTKQEENLGERTAQIERSLIKKFRKPIWRRFTKAIKEYELIQEGDKIAVCISGGKDSMLLAKLIQEIKKHGQISFDAIFLVMNPGYNEDNWNIIQNNAKILGIPLTVFNTEIFDVVAGIEKIHVIFVRECDAAICIRRQKNSAAIRSRLATILMT